MKKFDYATAINQLGLDKKTFINDIKNDRIPKWVQGKDLINSFLPYLCVCYDSREQNLWVADACSYYGIKTIRMKKDKKQETENLKEGDLTFRVEFGNKTYDYAGVVSYERKSKPTEIYANITQKRETFEKEIFRQKDKNYKKFVILMEMGNCLLDLINYKYSYYKHTGEYVRGDFGNTVFNTIMSWRNRYKVEVLQVDTQNMRKGQRFEARTKLFWLMIIDMFFFFRQELRMECIDKNLIEEINIV